jgi:hypothetical protein
MTLRLGADTARDTLRGSNVRVGALLAAALSVASGLECRASDSSGPDRALLGFTLPLIVPLACLGVLEGVYGRPQSAFLTEPLARHGADRHRLALGATLVTVVVSAVLGSTLCLLAALAARTPSLAGLSDLYASTWGGALTGAAYAGLFALGSLWGRRGRFWLFCGDWLFGSGSGVFALPWVRGHARNLLGGDPVLAASQSVAAAALVLIASLSVLVSARRGPS